MVNSIKKGKAGEVEFEKWFYENLGESIEREYNQAAGGCDIITNDFYIEVKRRETLNLKSWWQQVTEAARMYNDSDNGLRHQRPKGRLPVVAFRQNRKAWEFLLPAEMIGIGGEYLRVTKETFIKFAKQNATVKTS